MTKPEGIHKTARITYTHPRSHGTADLYHSAQLIVNYVFTVLKKTPQLPSNLHVPRVYGCTMASKAPRSVHGAVVVPFKRPRTTIQTEIFMP